MRISRQGSDATDEPGAAMHALPLIIPDWPAPCTIGAAMSTRRGGVSRSPFDDLNLRPSGLNTVGAAPEALAESAENIARWQAAIGVRPVFLQQVHGREVANLDGFSEHGWGSAAPSDAAASKGGQVRFPIADAAVTTRTDIACTVLVADCLPVFLTDSQGRAVAAAHAGWRGLGAGVLEATVAALCRAATCEPGDVVAWLGPCIGPSAFEVGEDVLQAFGLSRGGEPSALFAFAPRVDGTQRWKADLAGLAQARLRVAGVTRISASGLCTVSDPLRFFSFRRDGLTGRMAASIWRGRG